MALQAGRLSLEDFRGFKPSLGFGGGFTSQFLI